MAELPLRTVVVDRHNDVFVKVTERGVERTGAAGLWGLTWISYPATIIFQPDLNSTMRDALAEEGRQLASEREDLIAAGADPAELLVPLHPAGEWIDPDCRGDKHRACPGWTLNDDTDATTPCECPCHDPQSPEH